MRIVINSGNNMFKKSAHAGGAVKTVGAAPKSSHNSNDVLSAGRGPKANQLSPVGKRMPLATHGKKAGTIDALGNG